MSISGEPVVYIVSARTSPSPRPPLYCLAHIALGGLAIAHCGLQPRVPEDLANYPKIHAIVAQPVGPDPTVMSSVT